MKKRSLIFGIAMFVSMALIFSGCEQEAEDDGGDAPVDVKSSYFLVNGDTPAAGVDTSGLEIASAWKSSSGDVTIVLTGTVKATHQAIAIASGATSKVTLGTDATFSASWSAWGSADGLAGAEPGIYGAAYIDGLLTRSIVAGTVAIKQTNEALRLYKGTGGLLEAKPEAPAVTPAGNIWLPAADSVDTPIKWKAYVDGNGAPNLGVEPLGVLIWDGGTGTTTYPNKIATVEVAEVTIEGGSATVNELRARYIIDYTGVTFAPNPVAGALALAEELGTGATANGTTVTLSGTEPIAIATDKTVTVADGVTLSVPSSVTLTVAGKLNVEGDLNVVGTINNSGSIEVSGKYTIATGTSGTNSGTVTVKSGGEVQSYAQITGTGTNTVEAGGKVAFGKDGSGNPVYIVGGGSDTAAFTLSEGKLSYTNTSFTLDGKAALNGIAGANSDSMGNAKSFLINSANQVLTVKAGGELTIAADAKFLPRITNDVQPLVGEPTAKVIFKSGGFMWYDTGINFYDSTGTALTGNTYTASADTSYNWDAAAGGDAKPGWKAGS